jgi:hypothetical protein
VPAANPCPQRWDPKQATVRRLSHRPIARKPAAAIDRRKALSAGGARLAEAGLAALGSVTSGLLAGRSAPRSFSR